MKRPVAFRTGLITPVVTFYHTDSPVGYPSRDLFDKAHEWLHDAQGCKARLQYTGNGTVRIHFADPFYFDLFCISFECDPI